MLVLFQQISQSNSREGKSTMTSTLKLVNEKSSSDKPRHIVAPHTSMSISEKTVAITEDRVEISAVMSSNRNPNLQSAPNKQETLSGFIQTGRKARCVLWKSTKHMKNLISMYMYHFFLTEVILLELLNRRKIR